MSASAIRAGKAFVSIEAIDNTARVLRSAQANLSKFASNIQTLGKRLMVTTGILTTPLAFALRGFQQFDDQMRIVKAVSGSTEAEFRALTAQAKELGRTTSFTAVEVAALQKELGKAGFSADQVQAMTPHTLDLSRAADVPTDVAAGIVASSLRQFNMEASETQRVADGLTQAANGTFNSVQDIGEALKYVGPIANQFNMSFEETLALVGALGNIGIQGSMAGTVLRNLQLRASAMSKDFRAIGVETMDAGGNLRNLIDILDDVDKATSSMGTGQRAEILNKLFGVRSVTGGSSLAGDTGGVREILKQIEEAGGVASRSAKDFDSGIGGAFRRFISALEGVTIAIGESTQWLGGYLDKGAELLGLVTSWVGANQKLVTSFLVVLGSVAAVGAGLVGLGVAIKIAAFAFTPLHQALGLLRPLMAMIPTLIGLLTGPLLKLALIVAALAPPLLVVAWKWQEIWTAMVSMTRDAIAGVSTAIRSGAALVSSSFAQLTSLFSGFIAAAHAALSERILGRLLMYLTEDTLWLISFLGRSLVVVGGIVKSALSVVTSVATAGISAMVNFLVSGPIGRLIGYLAEDIPWLLARIPAFFASAAMTALSLISPLAAQIVRQIAGLLQSGVNAIISSFSAVASIASELVSGSFAAFGAAGDLVKGLFSYLLSVGPTLVSTLGAAWSVIATSFGTAWANISSIFATTWAGIMQKIMSGDLTAAMQVSLAGLRAVWAEALAALQRIWIQFKGAVAEAWLGMLNLIQNRTIQVQTNIADWLLKKAGEDGAVGAAARTIVGADLRGGTLADDARAENQRIGAERQHGVDAQTGAVMQVLGEDLSREMAAAGADAAAARAELDQLISPAEWQGPRMPDEELSPQAQLMALAGGAAAIPSMGPVVSKTLPDTLERGTVDAAKKAYENRQESLLNKIASAGTSTADGIDDLLDLMREMQAGFVDV